MPGNQSEAQKYVISNENECIMQRPPEAIHGRSSKTAAVNLLFNLNAF